MAAAAAAEIGGFTAARMAAPALRPAAAPAPAAAAPPQPSRRAVTVRSLRTAGTETLTADLAGATNGAVHAQVSGILLPFSLHASALGATSVVLISFLSVFVLGDWVQRILVTSIALMNSEATSEITSQAVTANSRRKTKIVCTIGPSTNTREMIWKLAETGMNVARLNMSHGDHQSHQKVIDLVKEYNAQNTDGNVIAIMLDTKGPEVRSGDVPEPIMLKEGQEFNFTIKRGVSTEDTVSVNYDDFINDVEVGDILLVDEKDWEDIKFGVENGVDFYAVSFVKDAKVIHELKDYLKGANADIHVIPKIESADSIPNLQSIIAASDGAMVARGDLGAELPIEDVPLLQAEIVQTCRSMEKPVIVATNMLESMINHPTPTRAEVSDIAIAVREGADAVMLSGETAHGKYPLKAVKVMHTVALRTESSLYNPTTSPSLAAPAQGLHNGEFSPSQLSNMFGSHATMMANTLCTPIIVFTQTGSMAVLLSHYRPSSTIFAFTNEERVKQRLALYQGVIPIHMQFSDDAEETFSRAISSLLKAQYVKKGDYVTLVQSGVTSIWREESTHHIQVRKVEC
ncbi:Pyruvate kinase isozyme G, chloroplastic [Dichanthelium oligosanthes]|uniref:pyruvate kinase n=1 Tax=Dichanthelium oligosanthes TaxID=888268 RepID=A0A1E5WDJ7_9POAL|nr:Pyruvate kinase isozyme G, chloroplastic [Dichanthelium oligosanthes]